MQINKKESLSKVEKLVLFLYNAPDHGATVLSILEHEEWIESELEAILDNLQEEEYIEFIDKDQSYYLLTKGFDQIERIVDLPKKEKKSINPYTQSNETYKQLSTIASVHRTSKKPGRILLLILILFLLTLSIIAYWQNS